MEKDDRSPADSPHFTTPVPGNRSIHKWPPGCWGKSRSGSKCGNLLACTLDDFGIWATIPYGQTAVFRRDCGATTDFSSMVNLQNWSDKFSANEGRLFAVKGRYQISVTWTGSKQMVITCNGCQRRDMFREVTVEGDIDISYKFVPH